MSTRLTRRQLFRLRIGDLPALVRQAKNGHAHGDGDAEPEAAFFRPPGALADEDRFLATCERCRACADACPHGVISHFGASAGPREGTPFLDPNTAPCRWCGDMDCIRACPSGALAFGPEERVEPIGKAELDLETCLTSQGILCDSCAVACPPNVRAIKIVNRQPQLDWDRCTGCGLCVWFCQSRPAALKIIPPSLVAEETP
jgi:ferredoxin-type protein NapG